MSNDVAKQFLNIMVNGTGADTSAFRRGPYVMSLAKSGLRAVPFAVPAAVAVAWLAYPALDPEWKKANGIP